MPRSARNVRRWMPRPEQRAWSMIGRHGASPQRTVTKSLWLSSAWTRFDPGPCAPGRRASRVRQRSPARPAPRRHAACSSAVGGAAQDRLERGADERRVVGRADRRVSRRRSSSAVVERELAVRQRQRLLRHDALGRGGSTPARWRRRTCDRNLLCSLCEWTKYRLRRRERPARPAGTGGPPSVRSSSPGQVQQAVADDLRLPSAAGSSASR